MPDKFLPLRATPTTTATSPGDAVRAAAQWLEDALAGYSTGSAALQSPYVQAGRDIIAQLRDYAAKVETVGRDDDIELAPDCTICGARSHNEVTCLKRKPHTETDVMPAARVSMAHDWPG